MWRLILCLLPMPALACERPVCVVDPETLAFARQVTFDNQPSSFGAGRDVRGIMALDGVSFGERFAGQFLTAAGDFDRVDGEATGPLVLVAGADRQNMTIIRLSDTNVLTGDGPALFPAREATGEGALAVLFDREQVSLRFDIRGGEGGTAWIVFLRRDGSVIDSAELAPLSEASYGFQRNGRIPDIAGLVVTNADPDGIALDTLAFDGADQTS